MQSRRTNAHPQEVEICEYCICYTTIKHIYIYILNSLYYWLYTYFIKSFILLVIIEDYAHNITLSLTRNLRTEGIISKRRYPIRDENYFRFG